MLKFENKFEKYDIIRAYDFQPMEGRGDCYVEGEVVDTCFVHPDFGYKAYAILCGKDVFDGKETTEGRRNGHIIYVPMEVNMMEYDDRIQLVTKRADR